MRKIRNGIITKTNLQQSHFYWGRSETIYYSVNGRKLTGALYFPANYDPSIKYPMVVEIYQRLSQNVNEYVNPTLLNEGGFNITNYTTQGYFVLQPDIVYEFGKTGQSATDCVLAAVDAVIGQVSVDPAKVGLIGHSFGGFETDMILTKTNRFSAAVSGAAWTDIVSAYLYVGASFWRPDYHRTESDQLRIGKSLYEDRDSYFANSPVLHADKVSTPLLSWTGEEDRHIHYLQTVEFYLALRRLNKKHTMLIYPGEEHSLVKPKNQADLTKRVRQWFDYYLKGTGEPAINN